MIKRKKEDMKEKCYREKDKKEVEKLDKNILKKDE